MYSLHVPVPGQVRRLADELHPRLVPLDRVRNDHALLLKRLGDPSPAERPAVEGRARRALAGTAPFDVRVTDVAVFEDPPAGPGPVVYLAVEGPELRATHRRLCEAFDPVEGLEHDDYVPHVTLGRGGRPADARALAAVDVDPVEWTVDRLEFRRGGADGTTAGHVRLPV